MSLSTECSTEWVLGQPGLHTEKACLGVGEEILSIPTTAYHSKISDKITLQE